MFSNSFGLVYGSPLDPKHGLIPQVGKEYQETAMMMSLTMRPSGA